MLPESIRRTSYYITQSWLLEVEYMACQVIDYQRAARRHGILLLTPEIRWRIWAIWIAVFGAFLGGCVSGAVVMAVTVGLRGR